MAQICRPCARMRLEKAHMKTEKLFRETDRRWRETDKRFREGDQRLRDMGKHTDERIEKLVSAIGELIRRSGKAVKGK